MQILLLDKAFKSASEDFQAVSERLEHAKLQKETVREPHQLGQQTSVPEKQNSGAQQSEEVPNVQSVAEHPDKAGANLDASDVQNSIIMDEEGGLNRPRDVNATRQFRGEEFQDFGSGEEKKKKRSRVVGEFK